MKEDSFDDELFNYFKDRYETEIDRNKGLGERISLGVTVLTVLGGIAAYYLSSFKFCPFHYRHLFFYIPFGLAVGCLLISLFRLLNVFSIEILDVLWLQQEILALVCHLSYHQGRLRSRSNVL